MIFPSLFMLTILPIAEVTLKNTSGTMIINIRFKNKSPRGSTTAASGPTIAPIKPPTITAASRMIEDLYAFNNFIYNPPTFFSFIVYTN
jgi:hypothetical protein